MGVPDVSTTFKPSGWVANDYGSTGSIYKKPLLDIVIEQYAPIAEVIGESDIISEIRLSDNFHEVVLTEDIYRDQDEYRLFKESYNYKLTLIDKRNNKTKKFKLIEIEEE